MIILKYWIQKIFKWEFKASLNNIDVEIPSSLNIYLICTNIHN